MAAACLLLFAQVSSDWYVTRDGASYLSIARSLAQQGAPTNLGQQQLFFAPCYSFLIAPLYWISDRPILALSLLNAALGVALLFSTRSWISRFAPDDAALIAATCVINASVGILLRRTLSEALFMPAMVVTVLLLEHVRAATVERLPVRAALGAGVALAMVCLTRQAGLTTLPGFAIALGVTTSRSGASWRRAAMVLALVAVPALAAVAGLGAYERATAVEDARTYADFLAADSQSFPAQVRTGLVLRISEIGRVALPGMFKAAPDASTSGWLNFSLYAATALAVVYGAVRMLRRNPDTFLCIAPFYVALYVVWPFDEGIRFLAPLAPVWLIGLYFALPEVPALRRRVAWLSLITHAIVAVGYWLANDRPEARRDNAEWPALDRLAQSIDVQAGPVAWQLDGRDHERAMFQLSIDRPVNNASTKEAVAEDVTWLVTTTGALPADFDKITTGGNYTLWRRRP
ncbi:MAG: hypothetical protein SGJ19_14895 [Planctomycetia bacterium]|nr:hypothetical protein [Planctomycetia bacterium]